MERILTNIVSVIVIELRIKIKWVEELNVHDLNYNSEKINVDITIIIICYSKKIKLIGFSSGWVIMLCLDR